MLYENLARYARDWQTAIGFVVFEAHRTYAYRWLVTRLFTSYNFRINIFDEIPSEMYFKNFRSNQSCSSDVINHVFPICNNLMKSRTC